MVEVVRAAVLACHSAGSLLAAAGDRDTARLLRSAEATSRAAVARLILVGQVSTGGEPAGATEQVVKEKGKKRVRKKKAKDAKSVPETGCGQEDVHMALGPTVGSLVAACQSGGSVVLGDLSEFGVEANRLEVFSSSSQAASTPAPTAGSSSAASWPSLSQFQSARERLQSEPLGTLRLLASSAGISPQGKKWALVERLLQTCASASGASGPEAISRRCEQAKSPWRLRVAPAALGHLLWERLACFCMGAPAVRPAASRRVVVTISVIQGCRMLYSQSELL